MHFTMVSTDSQNQSFSRIGSEEMVIPEYMSAVLLTGIGGIDKLEYRDDVPVPEEGRLDE